MIETIEIAKSFDSIKAVDGISLQIKENSVFGLVGTNGAGKSTFMRMICGILVPDRGEIRVDHKNIFENVEMKREIFFLSDDQYYYPNATAKDMMNYYHLVYPGFDKKRFMDLVEKFNLNPEQKMNTFSKGMKKQIGILLGICSNCKYLLCDETFDGLDPVMRQGVKSLFAGELEEREFTPIIASHNLRELEDICDTVGLLHKGGVILNNDLEVLRTNLQKVQCVFASKEAEQSVLEQLDIAQKSKRGSLCLLTVRGTRDEVMDIVSTGVPIFSEVLPLTLEEIFISETEAVGYDIKKLIL